MSRAAIPTNKEHAFLSARKQVCIYAFPRSALIAFAAVPKKTTLEEIEDIEILRFLELGYEVHMIDVSSASIAVDVSEGKNLDSSAFSVIDISTTPYRQVATYSSSSISPILFPTVIVNAARVYNDAYVLVEINNNPQVADFIHNDLEYENLLKVFTGNKKPQQLSAGFARGVQMGLKMSPQVKQIGCSNLKTLIEGDKLLINDFDTYSELTTFEQHKTSFAAAEGANDDMAMTLVIFAWATTQQYFREIVNHDLRKQIQLENMNQIDEDVLPAPIIDDGLEHDFMVEGGDIWEVSNGGDTYGGYTKKWFEKL
jgi:hypothetical protein